MTAQHTKFANKYRPKNFTELLAQSALTKVLSYSISNNRISQSYLLTGIRGIGKTSAARIIAKTINCSATVVENGYVVPCDTCANCRSVAAFRHPDIIEIDGASRTSVDDIRDIIGSCDYRPLLGKYKIFIIDEVHMLSKSAFSALLKILEEPASHVIFIFATTEVQKIPLTIISRCQRYDLRRFTFEEIFQLIKNIATQENLLFTDEALNVITSCADGSARDAITMLDQASNLYTDTTKVIEESAVNQMLGLFSLSKVIELFEKILEKDSNGALEIVYQIYQCSGNVEKLIQAISDLVAFCSKAIVVNSYHDKLYSSYEQRIKAIISTTNLAQLTILWQIFNNGLRDISKSHNSLIAVEMLIIKAIYSVALPSIDEATLLSGTQNPPRQCHSL